MIVTMLSLNKVDVIKKSARRLLLCPAALHVRTRCVRPRRFLENQAVPAATYDHLVIDHTTLHHSKTHRMLRLVCVSSAGGTICDIVSRVGRLLPLPASRALAAITRICGTCNEGRRGDVSARMPGD